MIFLQGFIKFDQGISEKCVGQTFDGRKKERKKKNNNKKQSKHNMSPKLCLGDIKMQQPSEKVQNEEQSSTKHYTEN